MIAAGGARQSAARSADGRRFNQTGEGLSRLTVPVLGAELGIDYGGRWTYSSSIDWAPSMLTTDNASKRATFGFGIWKSVYLVRRPLPLDRRVCRPAYRRHQPRVF